MVRKSPGREIDWIPGRTRVVSPVSGARSQGTTSAVAQKGSRGPKEALKSQYFVDEDLSAFGDDDFVQYRDDRPVEDAVLLALEADELNDVLSRLPERDQLLLRGKYQFSLSDEALSRELHCEVSSIRMMLTRARNHARALLNMEGITI